nr:unnamed protein product [Spirometra erinaceieuropaei]
MVPKANEMQGYADSSELKNSFSATPRKKTCTASQPLWINAYDEEVADSETSGQALQKRPQPSLRNLRLRHRPAPQVAINIDQDLPSSLPKFIRVVQQLSSKETSGTDAIPSEIYEHGSRRLLDQMTALFR